MGYYDDADLKIQNSSALKRFLWHHGASCVISIIIGMCAIAFIVECYMVYALGAWPHQVAAVVWGTFFVLWGMIWLALGKPIVTIIAWPASIFFYGTIVKEYFFGW